MKSMIQELWHGNILPGEDSRNHVKEMKALLGYMARRTRIWKNLHRRVEGDLRKVLRSENKTDRVWFLTSETAGSKESAALSGAGDHVFALRSLVPVRRMN